MLRLELVTTAEYEAMKEFEDESKHGTAVLRRLTQLWAGSRRIVCTDTYFARVSSAAAYGPGVPCSDENGNKTIPDDIPFIYRAV